MSENKHSHLKEQLERVLAQRNEAQDRIVEWHRCPQCGLPVPMSGLPVLTGECRCGALVTESDMGEAVDPLDGLEEATAEIAGLKERVEFLIGRVERLVELTEAYRARRVVDGGGGLERPDGSTTPSRPYNATDHYNAELKIEDLELAMKERGELCLRCGKGNVESDGHTVRCLACEHRWWAD